MSADLQLKRRAPICCLYANVTADDALYLTQCGRTPHLLACGSIYIPSVGSGRDRPTVGGATVAGHEDALLLLIEIDRSKFILAGQCLDVTSSFEVLERLNWIFFPFDFKQIVGFCGKYFTFLLCG